MNGKAFKVLLNILVPNLWDGAVVVMDNLPAHKLALIEPLIQSAGASVLNLSPYSPDFNPIELWWSQLKAFYVSSRQPLPKWLTYCLLLHLIWLILSTSKTGLQAAVTVLHKPGYAVNVGFNFDNCGGRAGVAIFLWH